LQVVFSISDLIPFPKASIHLSVSGDVMMPRDCLRLTYSRRLFRPYFSQLCRMYTCEFACRDQGIGSDSRIGYTLRESLLPNVLGRCDLDDELYLQPPTGSHLKTRCFDRIIATRTRKRPSSVVQEAMSIIAKFGPRNAVLLACKLFWESANRIWS
jgi:hypothetical protein